MKDVLLRFEREDREGVVAVGSYLIDAARRMGIELTAETEKEEAGIEIPIEVTEGADILSAPTDEERELIASGILVKGQRLASQTRVMLPGEVVVMTTETKKKKAEKSNAAEDYSKQFAELPLEKKISQLVELEMMTLGDTVSFVLNSPYAVANKIMDVMSEFGLKKEAEEKTAARPANHKAETKASSKTGSQKAQGKTKTAHKDKKEPDQK